MNIINFDYNKSIIKEIRLFINLNNIDNTSYLAPILGQYGVKPIDFISKFSNEVIQKLYLNDFILPIKVIIYSNSDFIIEYLKPTVCYLLSNKTNNLTILDIYKICIIKSFNLNNFIFDINLIKNNYKMF